jgi:hypothetical protein
MGMDSSRWGGSLCVAVAIAGLLLAPVSAREQTTGIWKVLRDGGFSGAKNEDAHVRSLGDMDIGGRHYRLMFFEWFETPRNMKGSFPHGQSRLLVFEKREKAITYLGSYVYYPPDGSPRIEGNAVIFPYKEIKGEEPTNRLVFDQNGPPLRVVLDGEICEFFK